MKAIKKQIVITAQAQEIHKSKNIMKGLGL